MEAPDCLRVARRMLEHLPFCEIVDDLSLCENHWTIHFRIQIKSTGEIPPETLWYAILPEAYPYGEIELCPAKKGGIEKTYWHQSYNSPEMGILALAPIFVFGDASNMMLNLMMPKLALRGM